MIENDGTDDTLTQNSEGRKPSAQRNAGQNGAQSRRIENVTMRAPVHTTGITGRRSSQNLKHGESNAKPRRRQDERRTIQVSENADFRHL